MLASRALLRHSGVRLGLHADHQLGKTSKEYEAYSQAGSFTMGDAKRFGRLPLYNRKVKVWDGAQYDPENPYYVYTTTPEAMGSFRHITNSQRMVYLFVFLVIYCVILSQYFTPDTFVKGLVEQEAYRRRRLRLEWQERELLLDWPDENAKDFPLPASPYPQMTGSATLQP